MAYKVVFEARVFDDVAALSQGNRKAFKVCVELLRENPANHAVHPIRNHRCRKAHFAGNLRAIFDVQGATIRIVMVGRSTEALYRTLSEELPPEESKGG